MEFPILPEVQAYLEWLSAMYPPPPGYRYHQFLKGIKAGSRKGQADIWHLDRRVYMTASLAIRGSGTEVAPQAFDPGEDITEFVGVPTGWTVIFPGTETDVDGTWPVIHRSPPDPGDRLVLISYIEKS